MSIDIATLKSRSGAIKVIESGIIRQTGYMVSVLEDIR